MSISEVLTQKELRDSLKIIYTNSKVKEKTDEKAINIELST